MLENQEAAPTESKGGLSFPQSLSEEFSKPVEESTQREATSSPSKKEIILEQMKQKEQQRKQQESLREQEKPKVVEVKTTQTDRVSMSDKISEINTSLGLNKTTSQLAAERDKVMQIQPNIVQTKLNLTLSDFPDAWVTWGANLNPTGEILPGKFKAIYFDSERQEVINTLSQDDVSINRYSSGNTKDFWAYFVGEIEITQSSMYEFFTSESWATSRVILDGKEIMKTGGKNTISLQLEPKKYKLEVEFLNDWHVIDFAVGYSEKGNIYTAEEAQIALRDISNLDNLEVWYTWVYESTNPWHKIPVVLKPTPHPVVLMLSSYSTVNWEIQKFTGIDLRAVVYSGYEPWVMVTWLPDNIPIIRLDKSLYAYRTVSECKSFWSIYNCDSSARDFPKIQTLATTLFGKKPTGFSWEYWTSMFTIPEQILDAAAYTQIQADLNTIEKEKREFNKR